MLGLVAVLAFAGCTKDQPAMPTACRGGDRAVTRALAGAPRGGALADGTLLSECVHRARSDADLQNLGLVLNRVAAQLGTAAQQGDEAAAARLGFLAGAVRRGAALSHGVGLELSHRIDAAARGVDAGPPRLRRALAAGLDAGQARG
jgi:hypothetical protein